MSEQKQTEVNDLREIIRQELERSEILKKLEDYEATWSWVTVAKTLRHPLVLTVVGFLLTAVIGSQLERRISGDQERRYRADSEVAAARSEEVSAQAEMSELVAMLHARTQRGAMLRSAISRGDDREIVARKKLYDQAYFEWIVALNQNLISLRRHVYDSDGQPVWDQSEYEDYLVSGLVPILARMDSCLTDAYDKWRRAPEGLSTLTCAESDAGNSNASDERVDWIVFLRAKEKAAGACMDSIMADGMRYFRARAETRAVLAREPGSTVDWPLPDTATIAVKCVVDAP